MIQTNLTTILQTIHASAVKAGRNPSSIQLVAVSKRVPVESIQLAVESGQLCFGENYFQEASEKIPQVSGDLSWHFIGHLQSNKVKEVVTLFDIIETVDRIKIARLIDSHAQSQRKNIQILLQVNVGGEQQTSGVSPEQTEALIREINKETQLQVIGLMTLPPYFSDPEKSRPFFKKLRLLATELAKKQLFADNKNVVLSMGMSGDYPIAIEEGATLVRVGTALFGERIY